MARRITRQPKPCPWGERIAKLKGENQAKGYGLRERMFAAVDLARGPDPQRSAHWAWEAVARTNTLEEYLSGAGV